MKINRGTGYYNNNISFIDMLFNILMIFVLLFFIALLLMNPPEEKKKDIEAKADILVVMSWPDKSPHDIDLWVKPPEGPPIHYNFTENSFMHLDLDDRGASNNWVDGKEAKKILPSRREVISLRGKQDGRYVVNVNFFSAKDPDSSRILDYTGPPIPVMVELIQINPKYKILARKEVLLEKEKDASPVFAFIVERDVLTEIETEDVEQFIYQPMYDSSGNLIR